MKNRGVASRTLVPLVLLVLIGALGINARLDVSTLTFSEFPVGTTISTQYASLGVTFSGSGGIPVYPANNLKGKVYTTSVKGESQAHILASDGFFWINKSRLAFVDRFKKVNRLVLVDLTQGIDQVKVRIKPLDTMALVDVKSCQESVGAPENLIQITDISSPSEKNGFVRLTFEPVGQCLTRETFDIAIN